MMLPNLFGIVKNFGLCRGISKNNPITLFLCFTFIPKTEITFYSEEGGTKQVDIGTFLYRVLSSVAFVSNCCKDTSDNNFFGVRPDQ